jgi:hypothetical protein
LGGSRKFKFLVCIFWPYVPNLHTQHGLFAIYNACKTASLSWAKCYSRTLNPVDISKLIPLEGAKPPVYKTQRGRPKGSKRIRGQMKLWTEPSEFAEPATNPVPIIVQPAEMDPSSRPMSLKKPSLTFNIPDILHLFL